MDVGADRAQLERFEALGQVHRGPAAAGVHVSVAEGHAHRSAFRHGLVGMPTKEEEHQRRVPSAGEPPHQIDPHEICANSLQAVQGVRMRIVGHERGHPAPITSAECAFKACWIDLHVILTLWYAVRFATLYALGSGTCNRGEICANSFQASQGERIRNVGHERGCPAPLTSVECAVRRLTARFSIMSALCRAYKP